MNARILIAESDERKSDHLRRLLAPHYVVDAVADGESAIRAALADRPDLVIAELLLPGADGHEIVRRLRGETHTRSTPVILLCDTAIAAAKGGGHETPADDYLSRPFGSLELLMRVQSQLEMVRLRREGEERVMRILDGVTDAVQIVDERGRTVRYNAAWKALMGSRDVKAGDLVGQEFLQTPLAGPPDGPVARAFAAAMSARTESGAELFLPDFQRWFGYRFFPEEQGGLSIFVRDFTPQKQVEQALRLSEERRRLAVEAAQVYDWEFDRGTQRMIYGANVENVLGFALPADAAEAVALIHPDDRDAVSREYAESAKEGRTYLREYRFLHPVTHETIWVRSEGYHVRDASGASRFLGITQNITARKVAESAAMLLNEVSSALGRLNQPSEIRGLLGRTIGQWFAANRCMFIEVDEAAELVRVAHSWNAAGLAPAEGVYRMSEYVSDSLREELLRGHAVGVGDVARDPRTSLFAASYERDECRSFVAAPCRVHGKWRFLLTVTRGTPSAWSESDITLLHELATRIWLRLEQATYEEQLHVARERLEMAMEAAQIFWWEMNLTTGEVILSPNTSRIIGFTLPRGFPAMLELVHPDDRSTVKQWHASAMDGLGHLAGEFRLVPPGSKRPVWLSFQSARGPEGSDGHSRLFGITQNITDRKEAESLRAGHPTT